MQVGYSRALVGPYVQVQELPSPRAICASLGIAVITVLLYNPYGEESCGLREKSEKDQYCLLLTQS